MPTAIVTGGNSGIGRAAAVALAARGFDVGIAWHTLEDRARETLAECEAHGVRAHARQADLERVPGADAVVDDLAEALAGLTKGMALELGGHGIRVNAVRRARSPPA